MPTTRHRAFALALALLPVAPLAAQTPPATPQAPPDCRTDPVRRQFDFWIGTWDVFPWAAPPGQGPRLGVNVIEPILGGCALLEQWTDAQGRAGRSFNWVDRNLGNWRQLWIAEGGGTLDYTQGEFRDGAMRFLGWTLSPARTRVEQRLTFFAIHADTVRQLFETSTDSGRTWRPGFDGRYVRRGAGRLTREELAPGLHLFRTAPYSDVGLDGNSVAIIGDSGVLVFDANGTPEAARFVLRELRRLTLLPVRQLVLSHWHWDHWYGAEVYRDTFPALEIIAHERTRALMDGPAVDFNRPGLDAQLPGHIAAVEQALRRLRDSATAPDSAARARLARAERHLEADRAFLEQKRGVRHTLPTRTFTDSVVLRVGARRVVVRHVDRAITPGDAFLWLPDERIAVLGDLLLNPVTFGLFAYPSGWQRTLAAIDALDAALLVPGHGAPMRDERVLHATQRLLAREAAIVREVRAGGGTRAAARERILKDAEVLRQRDALTGQDPALLAQFPLYLVDWVVDRLWAEATGPLDDAIPRLP